MVAVAKHLLQTRPNALREFERERGALAVDSDARGSHVASAGAAAASQRRQEVDMTEEDMDEWEHELHLETELEREHQ